MPRLVDISLRVEFPVAVVLAVVTGLALFLFITGSSTARLPASLSTGATVAVLPKPLTPARLLASVAAIFKS